MSTCAHCGTQFEIGGSLTRGEVSYPLCHPNEGLDCYRLVTVYGEPVGSRMSTEREEAVRAVAEALDLQSGRVNPEFSVVQAEVAVEAMTRLGYRKARD